MSRSNDMTTGGEGTALRRLFVALLPDAPARDELVRRQRLLLPSLAHAKPTSRGNLHLTLAFLGMLGEEKSTAALDAMCEAARAFAASERSGRSVVAHAPAAKGADGPARALTLTFGDIGHFDKRGGSVLWQGIAEDAGRERLVRLQALLAEQLRERGLPLEDRPYVPHMTLARGVRLARGTRLQHVGRDARDARARCNEHAGRDENKGSVTDDAGAEPMNEFIAQVNARISSSRKEPPAMRTEAISLMWSHHPVGGELTYTEIARVPLA